MGRLLMADRKLSRAPHGGGHGPSPAYYALSFMGLATLFIVTGMLAVSFWLSRPVNYSPETDRLAKVLEQALLDNYIPAANIERGQRIPESTEMEEGHVRWTSHAFTVTLPPQLNAAGFKAQVRKDMSASLVKVLDDERGPGSTGESFSFYYDNLPFARLTVLPGTMEDANAARSDLRHGSTLLADLVEDVLETFGAGAGIIRSEAQEREDLNALWRYTRFDAVLPPGMTLGALKEQLEARNTIPDAGFSTDPQLEPPINLLATISGKPAVGLAIALAPAPAPERVEDVSLSGASDGALTGSEPVEGEGDGPPAPKTPMVESPVNPAAMGPTETGPEYVAAPEITAPAPETPRDTARPARMAIIIDDGGNNSGHSERILALDNRLTLAILPNTPAAVDTAERGAALGFEIMLHMPMETDSASEEAVEGTLFTAMGKAEIQKLTHAALDQIPHVAGLNNHTGSKFTSNKKKMGYCLDVVKERGLFFVDSYTTHTSVAYQTAVEMGVPAARRDVFLDNEMTVEAVRAQFAVLVEAAKRQGAAIGIGHFQSPATAKVLAEEIPKLADANIELVHASELVQ